MTKAEIEIKNMSMYLSGTVKYFSDSFSEGYLIKSPKQYQVAIPFANSCDYSDEFVGIRMRTGELAYDGKTMRVLYLQAPDKVEINKFVAVASQFILRSTKEKLEINPYEWFDDWRNIFGDTIKRTTCYDVLGEMIALRELLKKDKSALWVGPKSGSQDIVCDSALYEVKTSTLKKETVIHINSAIQLLGGKPEWIIFVRLEQKPGSSTIETLEKELIDLGYPEAKIEECLLEKGIEQGSKIRKIPYDLLEISAYQVTKDTFPLIRLADLNTQAPAKNITDFQLTLNLASIAHDTWFAK